MSPSGYPDYPTPLHNEKNKKCELPPRGQLPTSVPLVPIGLLIHVGTNRPVCRRLSVNF